MAKRKREKETVIWTVTASCRRGTTQFEIMPTNGVFITSGCVCTSSDTKSLTCIFMLGEIRCTTIFDILGHELLNPRVASPDGFNIRISVSFPQHDEHGI